MSRSSPPEDRQWNDSPLSDPAFRDRLRDLPPSAKLVTFVLDGDAPLAQTEIAERSLLPGRTARYALERLEEVDLVDGRPGLQDAREQVYVLSPNRASSPGQDGTEAESH